MRLLLVEDDVMVASGIKLGLSEAGYAVDWVGSGERAQEVLLNESFDIAVVDIGLPGENGFNVVEQLGKMQNFGLIIISARGSQEDNRLGLQSGADLYLVKPISFSHLVSSIDALWHRMQNSQTQTVSRPNTAERWVLNSQTRVLVSPSNGELKLSQQEHNLVAALSDAPQEVFSKETLHNLLFPYEEDSDEHRIDVILNRLRKKAREQHFKLPIHSIFGKGVVFTGQIIKK